MCIYIVTVFTLICGICSSVISLCNGAISFVLLYCYIVTLVRLSLVTIKGYLLACLVATTKPVVKKNYTSRELYAFYTQIYASNSDRHH